MPRTGIAAMIVVMSLAAAVTVDADDRPRRGRRGYDGRGTVRSRVVVRPPVIVHHYGAPRRAVPFGRLAYRPVYRPGLGIGIFIGSPYRYSRPYYSPRYYSPGYSYGYAPFAYAAPYADVNVRPEQTVHYRGDMRVVP